MGQPWWCGGVGGRTVELTGSRIGGGGGGKGWEGGGGGCGERGWVPSFGMLRVITRLVLGFSFISFYLLEVI